MIHATERRDAPASEQSREQFTLPQTCKCGAQGFVSFAPAPPPAPGEEDPLPAMVGTRGDFGLEGRDSIVCRVCGEHFGGATE